MAKIGIVTFSDTVDNYGQVLQYLATQEFLSSLGHEATLVKPQGFRRTIWRRIKWKFVGIKNKFRKSDSITSMGTSSISEQEQRKNKIFREWANVTEQQERESPRQFDLFRLRHFRTQTGTFDDVIETDYTAYCVGSDQTWSGAGKYMMLGWIPKKTKRFSIAPSVGHRIYTKEEVDSFKNYVHAFNFITVRENNGLELMHRCGRDDAIKVLDPTFLLTSQEYERFAKPFSSEKPYILVYLLGGEISVPVSDIIKFCKQNGFDVKYVESQGRSENLQRIPATVDQWLGLMQNASYVITNSFHGMAFSIIYHKPFLTFPLVGLMHSMNGRIEDLAAQMGLENRIYKNDLQMLLSPIEWRCADKVIAENKSVLTNMVNSLNL